MRSQPTPITISDSGTAPGSLSSVICTIMSAEPSRTTSAGTSVFIFRSFTVSRIFSSIVSAVPLAEDELVPPGIDSARGSWPPLHLDLADGFHRTALARARLWAGRFTHVIGPPGDGCHSRSVHRTGMYSAESVYGHASRSHPCRVLG